MEIESEPLPTNFERTRLALAAYDAADRAVDEPTGLAVDIGGSKRHAVSAGRLALGPAK